MFVHIMGLVGVLFVLITQIRINVMNLYSGSIALASGFEVAAHFKPGRPWWMFVVWFFGVVFYATNVINSLGTFLAITGVLTNTWVLIILADYFICRRKMGLGRTEEVEFHESEVRRWNPCGLLSLGIAVAVGALGIVGGLPDLPRLVHRDDPRTDPAHHLHQVHEGPLLHARTRSCEP